MEPAISKPTPTVEKAQAEAYTIEEEEGKFFVVDPQGFTAAGPFDTKRQALGVKFKWNQMQGGEVQPFARRGKWKGPVQKEQLGLGLELGKAYVPPGEKPKIARAAPEGAVGKPLGPQEIEATAINMASQDFTFKDWQDWLRGNVGTVSDVASKTLWRDAKHDAMLNATPDQLAFWVKKYDLAGKLGLRKDEKGNIVGIPEKPGRETFALEPLKEGQKPTTRAKKAEGVGTVYRTGKKYTGTEEKWQQIVSAVLHEQLKEIAPKADLDRKSFTIDDIAFGDPNTVEGSFRKISPNEARNPDVLMRVLGDQAETKDAPKSNTRRLLLVVDSEGNVQALSTYYDATAKVGEQTISSKPTRAEEPFAGVGELMLFQRQKPKTRKVWKMVREGWQRVMDPVGTESIKLTPAFLRKYTPIGSILLKEPVRNFRQALGKVGEYSKLEKQAMEIERPAREGFAGEAGEEAAGEALSAEEQEKQYWREQLRGVAERQEEGTPGIKGQGGSFQGEHATEARLQAGMTPGEIPRSYVEPLKASELESALDFLMDEVGDIKSVEDVRAGFDSLAERARMDLLEQQKRISMVERRGKGKPMTWRELMAQPLEEWTETPTGRIRMVKPWLQGIHRQTISALQKIAESIENEYKVTPDEAWARAIESIASNIIGRKDLNDFIQRTLAQYGEKAEKSLTVPGTPTKSPRPVEPDISKTKGELTAPTGIPHITTKPEPPYVHTEVAVEPGPFKRAPGKAGEEARIITKRPGFVIRREPKFELKAEGEPGKPEIILGPETRMELPAARRGVRKTIEESVKRRTVAMDIPRTLDGAEHISVVEAVDAENNIRMASMKADKTIPKKAREKEAVKFREAAIAAQSTIEKGVEAERERARAERRAAIEFAYQHNIPPTKEELAKIPSRAEFIKLHPELGEPKPNPANINKLIAMADMGIAKANKWIQGSNPDYRNAGKKWLKAALKLRQMAEYARDHWADPRLHETVSASMKELSDQFQRERAGGMSTQETFNYMPGLMEGDIFSHHLINFSGWTDRKGNNFRMPKKFANPYEAIAAGPYIPSSYDIAARAGNRIRRGNHILARREWAEGLKGLPVPGTKDRVAIEPQLFQREVPTIDVDTGKQQLDPDTGKPVTHTEYGYTSPDPDRYVLLDPVTGAKINVGYGRKPLAIRRGFEDIVTSTLSKSSIRQYKLGRAALHGTSALKHGWVLMADTFHLGRLSQYAFAAMPGMWSKITGKEAPGFGMGYKGGHSALSYRAEDMQKAADRGLIPQESVDWANEPLTINTGKGKTVQLTRHQIIREMVKQGLNAGQIADAMYKDIVRDVPIIGPYQKWLFDHFVPGLMAESAVRNFESLNAKHPEVNAWRLMRDVVRDTNATYGNMGRQGVFRDATLRDLLQIFLLAPGWREGLFQKEIRYLARLPAAAEYGTRKALYEMGMKVDPYRSFSQALTGREGLPPMGQLGAMMTKGLAAYFVLGQVINLISTGLTGDRKMKFTWENEGDHKLDAWLPIGKDGVWLPVLGVFGEIAGDIIRIGELKKNNWEIAVQMGLNMLGPTGRMANVAWTRETPTGQKLSTSWGIMKEMAQQQFPSPISASTAIRGAAHFIAPGMVAPNEPGVVPQRTAGSFGIKLVRGVDDETQIHRLAGQWARKQGMPEAPSIIPKAEQDSLSGLRHAIKIGDEGGARMIYQNLLAQYEKTPRGKGYRNLSNEDMVVRAMGLWRDRPFTGSREKEEDFRASLTGPQQELYMRADLQRMVEYQKVIDFIMRQPMK